MSVAETGSAQALAMDAFSEAALRRWLSLLGQPDRLDEPALQVMLRAHGRLPTGAAPMEVGRAAAKLLTEAIERLRPDSAGGRGEQLPYLVLKTCFLDRAKLSQASARLGISERQLSRERARALALLRADLQAPLAQTRRNYRPEQIPAIMDFYARPALSRSLAEVLGRDRLVHVHGPQGIGKTSLVAALAMTRPRAVPALWYRFRPGVNDSLTALLFELGEHLHNRDRPALSGYLTDMLPDLHLALLTRLALRELGNLPLFCVLDDCHVMEDDSALAGFLTEAVTRLPDLHVITIGRHNTSRSITGMPFAVPPFSRIETLEMVGQLGVELTPELADSLHRWTDGIPYLIKLAASWLKNASPAEIARGMAPLGDLDEVQDFLLASVADLMDSDDQMILEAASVFRDRFTDDALAFVANRTRGQVRDTSRRLVRHYVATRGLNGDVAFLHASVRNYLRDRLNPARHSELHQRAAEWYRRQGVPSEARYHEAAAEEPDAT